MRIALLLKIFVYKINYLILKFLHPGTKINGHCSIWRTSLDDKGHDNVIVTGRHVVLENCLFKFEGNHHKLVFGDDINIKGVTFSFEKEGAAIYIGSKTWIGPECFLAAMRGTKLTIGEKCLLGRQCTLRTSDSHMIFSDKRIEINHPQDIHIGNHVWLGEQVVVLKGTKIPDGCIVGTRSIVTSSLNADSKSILIGTPARIIKTNVTWEI